MVLKIWCNPHADGDVEVKKNHISHTTQHNTHAVALFLAIDFFPTAISRGVTPSSATHIACCGNPTRYYSFLPSSTLLRVVPVPRPPPIYLTRRRPYERLALSFPIYLCGAPCTHVVCLYEPGHARATCIYIYIRYYLRSGC